jgi:hypothetical protein
MVQKLRNQGEILGQVALNSAFSMAMSQLWPLNFIHDQQELSAVQCDWRFQSEITDY